MQPELRIIDANANRAAEGLRVMEDVARFALDHTRLAGEFKKARHDLQTALTSVPGGRLSLLASRDTPGDVGTGIKAEGTETSRSSLNAVAAAAGGRTTQALRAIEEAMKLIAPGAAGAVEHVRYRVYEAEKQLGLALGTGRAPQWRLCVLITEAMCAGGRPWLDVARAAIEGGADCIQLREKGLGDSELLSRAKALVELASLVSVGRSGGHPSVIINDRADIALLAGASGVHLGQQDASVASVRELAGDRLLVGVSTHNLAEARNALHDGADYVGVGAMFQTTTKVRDTSGPEYMAAFLEFTKQTRALPHLAIGGITPRNVDTLAAIGCRGVAVSSVVCGSDDPAGECRRLREALGE